MNQCDGCARGLPLLSDGNHYQFDELIMPCTADRYAITNDLTQRSNLPQEPIVGWRARALVAESENAKLKALLGEAVKELEAIAAINPNLDSNEGWNEWGEAECYRKCIQATSALLQRIKEAK